MKLVERRQITLYNIAGLTSEPSKELASESTELAVFVNHIVV